MGKMGAVARGGRTVLFVSHNMAAVENLCDWAILLEEGRMAAAGRTSDIINQYLTLFDTGLSSRDLADPSVVRTGSGEARFTSVSILSLDGENLSCAPMGQGIRIRMEIHGVSLVNGLELAVGLFNANGTRFCGFNSHDLAGLTFDIRAQEDLWVDCVIPQMNISPGTYRLNLLMRKRDRGVADWVEQAVSFEVVPGNVYGTGRIPAGRSLIFLDATWEQLAVRKPESAPLQVP
jgi:lipopolysaccharide transport system ATP-binding protein